MVKILFLLIFINMYFSRNFKVVNKFQLTTVVSNLLIVGNEKEIQINL